MSSRTGHMTTETVFGQTLALRLGDGDEHRALESDTTGLNVKGNLYLKLNGKTAVLQCGVKPSVCCLVCGWSTSGSLSFLLLVLQIGLGLARPSNVGLSLGK